MIFFLNTKIKEAYLGQAKFSSKVIYDELGLEILLRGAVVLIFPMVEIKILKQVSPIGKGE